MKKLTLLLLAAACGGTSGNSTLGGTTGTGTGTGTGSGLAENALAVTVDQGPAALTSNNEASANVLYTTVTVCPPGGTACQTIDHIQVDTGSVGLRLVAGALTAGLTKALDAAGNPLVECVQFVDSYDWGSVMTADVTLGSRKLSSMRVQVVGDAASGTAPASCVQGTALQTVEQFGANGLLGIGSFLQDCGSACAASAVPAAYYTCPSGTCAPVAVPLASQLPNPVALMSADNNGVVLQLPSVATPGVPSLSGTILFGINTQSNNALGTSTLMGLDQAGTFTTGFAGAQISGSFIDSGSNGYFFSTKAIPDCTGATGFFCPPAEVAESATMTFSSGAARTVSFFVDNAETIFNTGNNAAFPGLAGSNGDFNGTSGFDWGLPFFYGRNVFVLFEGQTVGNATGPAVGF